MGEQLWDFAVALYGGDGVSHACLTAQDDCGVDVTFVLAAAFAARRGLALSDAELARWEDDCARWRETVLVPLRRQRRHWQGDAAAAQDYAAIKALELAAERELLGRLEQRLAAMNPGTVPGSLADNLAAVFRHFGAPPAAVSPLLDVLRRAAD
jgi:uncharacterized protein (TIGR02444 family)